MNTKLLIAAFILATLTGCSATYKTGSTFSTKNSATKVTNSANIQPAFAVKSAWRRHVGHGTRGEMLSLQPSIQDGILYLTDVNGHVYALNASNGDTIWKVATKTPITTGVAAGNAHVFFGTDMGQLISIYKNGEPAWFKPVSNIMLAPPAVVGNMVIAKTDNAKVNAFDVQSGKQLWEWGMDSPSLILRASSTPLL